MLRWRKRLTMLSYLIGDMVSVFISLWLSFFLTGIRGGSIPGLDTRLEVVGFITIIALTLWIINYFIGVYDALLEEGYGFSIVKVYKNAIALMIGIIGVNMIFRYVLHISIGFSILALFFIIFAIVSHLIRFTNTLIFRGRRDPLERMSNILVLGYSERGARYIDTILKNRHLAINLVGFLKIKRQEDYNETSRERVPNVCDISAFSFGNNAMKNSIVSGDLSFQDSSDIKLGDNIDMDEIYSKICYMGDINQLPTLLEENYVDEVVVAQSLGYDEHLNDWLEDCQDRGITVTMLLEKRNKNSAKAHVAMIGDVPALKFHTVSLDEGQIMAKRILDVIGSLVGMVFFGVAYVIFAPLIKLGSKGPVIFKQERVGKNGRVFYIWKFRSMNNDAEKQKEKLMDQNEMQGQMFKMTNDPRVTKVGAFMRKTSIDELPQFYNVLVGDMSLVGTRPPTLKEVGNYQIHQRKRISITPGITGIWQISGRSDITDFEEVVRLDNEYIENWSVLLDIKILLKTVLVVLKKRGSK